MNKKCSELDQNPEKLNLIFSRLGNLVGNWSNPVSFPYFSESRAIRALSRVSFTGPWVKLVVGFGKTEDPAMSNPSAAELSGLSSSDNLVPVPLKRKNDRQPKHNH